MATAQLGPMVGDYKIAQVPLSLLDITTGALPFALSLDRILNGLTRPFFGWVSDNLGRREHDVSDLRARGRRDAVGCDRDRVRSP
jgi:OFA family oxalate/formate antiporter-like MFS transporter